MSHALEIEKVMTALRNLKWGEPVIAMAARVMDSCVSFLGRHLNSYVIHRKPNLIDREYRVRVVYKCKVSDWHFMSISQALYDHC